MKNWISLVLLACAQFVMVLDSSVMNVSITQIVEDLDTSIEGVQLAITAYTLVMASFMLVGATLGNLWGAHRSFAVGMIIYGTGSLITAFSPSLPVLLFGWSFIEGLGAALVMPAIAALVVTTYSGRERALAFGVIGGISGAAIAVGPVIGGWVTSTYTWRYVFIGEVVMIIAVMLFRSRMRRVEPDPTARLDVCGGAMSAAGLALVVFGVLQSGTWGWIVPLAPLEIGGRTIAPLGFSPVPFIILAGLAVLWAFAHGIARRKRTGGAVLVDLAMLDDPKMRSGLLTLLMQQLTLLGMFFVLPVYLQVVLGLDAFETGLKLLPLSGALLLFALAGPRIAARRSIRSVVYIGIALLSTGAMILASAVDVELNGPRFGIGLLLAGAGAGLLMSQLGNVIMSAAPSGQTSQAGGLQGTAQNLGASLGTALIGSVLIAGLGSVLVSNVALNDQITADVRAQITAAADDGIAIVPVDTVRDLVIDAGVSPDQAELVADEYADAQLHALTTSLFVVAMIALFALWPARRLPAESLDVAAV